MAIRPGDPDNLRLPARVASCLALAALGFLAGCGLLPGSTPPPPTAVPDPDVPAPTLFDQPWADRAIFEADLRDEQRGVLEALPEATVYHLKLELHDSLTELDAEQELLFTNQETVALDAVYLRLFPNISGGATDLLAAAVNGQAVEPGYELERSVLRLPLGEPLGPGERVVIRLSYRVRVPEGVGGNYGILGYTDEILALAHIYPMVAVYDDEGWNLEIPPDIGDLVYADSSFYVVQVTAPPDLVLATSGVEIEREESEGLRRTVYAAGPARDFYLAGSRRYEEVTTEFGPVTVRSFTLPEFAAAGAEALRYAVTALEAFEDRFGPYPYREFDLVSTPTLALGIEYPGIVAMAQRMYDPQDRSGAGRWLEGVTAHEVAHQWFYAVVGNDQLDEPWLDEAMAQYATLEYYGSVFGPGGYNGFRDTLVDRWWGVNQAAIPIGLPVRAFDGRSYSAIVYGRGPLFIEALAEQMGPQAFDAFLRDYYSQHLWGIATTESFRAAAEAACACDLTDLFQAWVYP